MEDFLKKCIRMLEDCGIDYVIVGGIAAIYYGEPRSTADVDVILRISEEDEEVIESFVRCVERHGFEILGGKKEIITALREKSHFSIFQKNEAFWIDAQGVYTRLNELAFEGRRRMKIFGVEGWLQGPEDLIIAKLTYYLSNRDEKDVMAILSNSMHLINRDRLERLALEFKVLERLRSIARQLDIQI